MFLFLFWLCWLLFLALGIYVVLRELFHGVHELSYMEWAGSVVVAHRFSSSTGMWELSSLTRNPIQVPFEGRS